MRCKYFLLLLVVMICNLVSLHNSVRRVDCLRFEATRQIRLMESTANDQIKNRALTPEGSGRAERHLPVLAMTADVIQATYEECMKCGMDGYVSKPFEEEQLYQAICKFLVSKSVYNS